MRFWFFNYTPIMNSDLPLASRRRRLVATVIDAVLVPSVTLVLVMIFGVVEDAEDYVDNGWIVWVLLLAITSYLLLNGHGLWRYGQTLGKRALGIAIVADPARTQALVRGQFWALVCIRALFFPLLFLLITPLTLIPLVDQLFIFSKGRRCLHDWVAGTRVVRVT